mmetsp:Transcript_32245/g.78338  ORF Transcript_32245/g.78338 Transcript_32245/m.78338 type:complete len:83 (+) Transcript_32245:1942-2190(+)
MQKTILPKCLRQKRVPSYQNSQYRPQDCRNGVDRFAEEIHFVMFLFQIRGLMIKYQLLVQRLKAALHFQRTNMDIFEHPFEI